MELGRRGRKRQLAVEDEYWKLILEGVGTVEACRQVGIGRKTGYRWRAERGGLPPLRLGEADHKGRYLSLLERQRIATLRDRGLGVREIARRLGRSPSTVSRELRRNLRPHDGGVYDGDLAHARARERARRNRAGRLAADRELRQLVQDKLQLEWSPEQIAAWLRLTYPDRLSWHVCHETIYQAVYHGGQAGLSRQLTRRLRTGRPLRKRRRRAIQRTPRFVAPATLIDRRPTVVETRTRLGDWEGDLITGRVNQSAIGTLVDRASRYVKLIHLPGGRSAPALRDALTLAVLDLPPELRRTLTWDQGSEMAHHGQIAHLFSDGVFFAYPGRPWERPSNENTNGLLRQYFPKRTDLSIHTSEDLRAVEERLNNRPRKTLGWRTPAHVLDAVLTPLRSGPPLKVWINGPWPDLRPGRKEVLDVEDWAEIRRLHYAEGLSIKEISRRVGVARNTVRSAVRSEGPPVFDRKPRPSAVDAVEPAIRELLAEFPRMPATVIAERISWERSLTILKDRVRELRPLFVPGDPCQRTEYRPGELAQWDLWFPAMRIPLGQLQEATLPVIVGVSGYSRTIIARLIPSRQAPDILCGHLACLLELGAVPRKGVYDNEAALVSRHNGQPKLTEPFQRFRGTLGMGVVICKPGDPEAKGLVERAIRYLETSFLHGRRFLGPQDFNAQLAVWLRRANNRTHSTLRCRPSDRIAEDRAAMMPLPPVLPDPAWRETKRLGRDHWVRVGTCDYSVHPRAIGRRVEVRMDLDEVVVTCAGAEVARHPRSWSRHRTITAPDHERARVAMRAFAAALADPDDVEVRDLTVYDRATGVA